MTKKGSASKTRVKKKKVSSKTKIDKLFSFLEDKIDSGSSSKTKVVKKKTKPVAKKVTKVAPKAKSVTKTVTQKKPTPVVKTATKAASKKPITQKATKAEWQEHLQKLIKFTQDKVHSYAQRILDTPDRADRSAMGELNFYIALRNVLMYSHLSPISKDPRDRPSYRDFGMVDAVNNTLKHLRIVTARKEKFYHYEVSAKRTTSAVEQLTKAEKKAQEKAKRKALIKFADDKVHSYAQRILDTPARADRSAMGELNFYIALRNVLMFNDQSPASRDARDRPSYRDFGLVGAVNDTLKHLGIVTTKKGKFYE